MLSNVQPRKVTTPWTYAGATENTNEHYEEPRDHYPPPMLTEEGHSPVRDHDECKPDKRDESVSESVLRTRFHRAAPNV